jgi:aspartate aminotransferase
MEYISLASGATYFNTPESASTAAIRAIQNHKTYYSLTEGMLALREAIAGRYLKINEAKVSPENILITPGTKQALYNILRNLVNPGDEVIVPKPNWFGLNQVLQTVQAQLVFWPTAARQDYALLPADLEKLITPKTRLVLISNPCNPTGRIYQEPELVALLTVLEKYPDIYLLSDEIYGLVTYDKKVPTLAQFNDPHQRHIIVNGFSKAFAMSGWRIGYLVMPPHLVKICQEFQQITFSGVSEFVQEAALAVMLDVENILTPMRQVLTQHRQIMLSFLDDLKLICFKPEAAYYVFPDFSAYLSSRIPTISALAQHLKENYALEILPGDLFGAPGYARLSFAIPKEKLIIALERLSLALKQLKSFQA